MQAFIDFIISNIYMIMGFIGFAFALILGADNIRHSDYSKKDKLRILVVGCIGMAVAMLSAKIANCFLFDRRMPFYDYTLKVIWEDFGFTFYFGLIGFYAASALLFWLMKLELKKIFYYITPAVPLFHGIARVGCALSGCCYGKEINLGIFGLTLHRFPTQFFESLFLFILFYILQYKLEKGRTIIYFSSYAVFRFLIEFFRGDDRGRLIEAIPLSTSQQVALGVLIVCGGYLLVTKLLKDRKAAAVSEAPEAAKSEEA